MKTKFDLNLLKQEVGKNNTEKGWHEEFKDIDVYANLLHSEVTEAVEDYRNNHEVNAVWYEYTQKDGTIKKSNLKYLCFNEGVEMLGKPCGVPSELADIVIRALDTAYVHNVEIELLNNENDLEYFEFKNFNKSMSACHFYISLMYFQQDFGYLSPIITLCFDTAKEFGIDLDQVITDKLAYNKTRAIKHGGKRF